MSKKPKKENPKTAKDAQKIRVSLKKNRQPEVRQQNLTHRLLSDDDKAEDVARSERVVSRSDVSRKRTLVGVRSEGDQLIRTVDETCQPGRVVSFIGLNCRIQADDGREFECTVRGVLRSLARDSRNMIVTGDRVLFRQQGDAHQGVIERVEPRTTVLSRGSQGREHVLVANVDQVLIVASAADPDFKPQLVDRFVMSAERRQIRPLICINKADLADSGELLSGIRSYGRA